VYAANSGAERKILWRNFHQKKYFVNNNPWFIIRDINLTLKPNEHSNGNSSMTADMTDFQDCLNLIEFEDICSTWQFYTWTKNLHKVKTGDQSGVLKKLDRVMSNEEFIKKFPSTHAVYHPYLISDHTPVILYIPTYLNKKVKSFRFSNFTTDK
jgi:hypothetical protein